MYITKTLKQKKTQHLDDLARASGRCYSKVVSLVRKTHKQKNFWLSKGSVQKYLRHKAYALHSQSIQACADTYFDSLKSFFQVRKSNSDAKPPKRTPRYFKVRWKSSAIRLRDGHLILSNGKGREPVILEDVSEKPNYVEMFFKRGHYYFALVYKVGVPPKQDTGITVSVDMGEIHPIVSFNGKRTTIYNGRQLRSIMQYRNKIKASFSAKMDRCEKRSKSWYKLLKAKRKTLDKLDAQIKDAEHKITSRFITDCEKAKADTIVIGDLKGIRDNIKYSKKSNQKLHQWAFARIADKITYKAELAGIHVVSESEAWTSQTCPQCGNRKKPSDRNYHCKQCEFTYHRDGVGAINIFNKVSGLINNPVVGTLAFPFGVRYNQHLCRSA
ncbi:transposase [Candidatus Poribacteria bacterium]|nr:transposase [Candidatus Poribacteria bacterium]